MTDNKSNYTRHLQTQNHIKNVPSDNKFFCDCCSKSFKYQSNLSRHKKTCNNNENNNDNNVIIENLLLKQKVKFLEEKETILKEKKDLESKLLKEKVENKLLKQHNEKETTLLKKHKKEISHEKDKQIEFLQQANIEKTRAVQTSNMNAITFASMYYNKTLKMAGVDIKAKYIDNGLRALPDMKIWIKESPELAEQYVAEKLIVLYSNEKFVDYICNIIKNAYKTENPMDQTFWSTDVSRLIYIVRSTIKKKDAWIYDKKGLKIKQSIIDPLLDEVNDILVKYIEKINKLSYSDTKMDYLKKLELVNVAKVILHELKNRLSLKNQIIKELAPMFYLDRNIKQLEYNKNLENDNQIVKKEIIKKRK